MNFGFYVLFFVLGLFVGSFLNCVIYRIEVKGNFLKGRSYCPFCKKIINFFDLIPVFSFLILKGKCRHCHSKISWQYPLVEILTGLIFLLIFNFQFSIFNELSMFQLFNLFYYWIIASLFIIVFVYDLKHFIVPDEAVIFSVLASLSWHFVNFFKEIYFLDVLIYYFLSGLGASLFFLFFYLMSKGKWMGFGDVKFAFAMGLFLGFPNIIVALFFSFLIGSLAGIIMIILKKKKIKSEIPFAPFLVMGSFLAFFWGEAMLTYYLMFFRIY